MVQAGWVQASVDYLQCGILKRKVSLPKFHAACRAEKAFELDYGNVRKKSNQNHHFIENVMLTNSGRTGGERERQRGTEGAYL